MPGSILAPQPTLVMPQSLCLQFSESREYVQLRNQYHDGTPQASQLAQTSRRTFKFSRRLTSSVLSQLWTFYQNVGGQLQPFLFYNPYEGSPVGSNYDSTGVNTTGRYICAFRNSWTQSTGMLRTDASNFELIQLPDMDSLYADLAGFGPHGAITAATLAIVSQRTLNDQVGSSTLYELAFGQGNSGSGWDALFSGGGIGPGPNGGPTWSQMTNGYALPAPTGVAYSPALQIAIGFELINAFAADSVDKLYIYDVNMQITFADSTVETIRPASYGLASFFGSPSENGTYGYVQNPQNAFDGDAGTYALIYSDTTSSRGGGAPALLLIF